MAWTQGLAWVVTEASSMMKWGPMRVTVTSNVNFDSWLMNIKIVGAVHYLVIGPHCLNASECHFVGQKSLLIPSPASCPVHSSAVPAGLSALAIYWCTWWADGQAVRRRPAAPPACRAMWQMSFRRLHVVTNRPDDTKGCFLASYSCLALPILPPGQSNMDYIKCIDCPWLFDFGE